MQNWTKDGSPDRFYTDDSVTFDDTATSFAISISGASVTPGNMVFDNTIGKDYTINGGTIGGTGSLTKKGSGTVILTQSGTNSFSGALTLEAGVLSISNLNQIGGGSSTRAVTLKGGTLQYTGTTQTTDALPLVLDSGSSTIEVTIGGTNTLRFGAATTGSGNLVKTGNGILALGKNGNNNNTSTPDPKTSGSTFTGTVTVNAGSLEIRNPDSLGANGALQGTSVNNASLIIFPYGQNQGITAKPEPLAISGTSYFITANQDADTDITNEWTGPVTVAANAVIGLGSPKANASFVAKFIISGAVTTNAGSVLNFGQNSATVSSNIQEIDVTGTLSGPASVTARGAAGSVYTLADPEYAGNTTVNSATLSLGADNSSNNASTVTIAATGAILGLNFAGIDTVDKLFIGGAQQNAGDYTSAHASGVFTGSGTLRVTSNPSGYSVWQTANGATGQSVAQDHDNDGVDNGIEYFMGQSGSGFTATPVLDSYNHISWPMGATYTGTYGSDYLIQTSSDLTTWSPVAVLGSTTASGGAARNQTLAGLTTTGLGGSVVGANETTNSVLTLNIVSGTNAFGGTLGGTGNENKLALIKSGNGTLTLTGDTTISTGTLALTGTGSIADSANLIVNGTLDVSGITAGTFTVGLGQTLSGVGPINATSKTLSILGTHAVGNEGTAEGVGTQTVTGNLNYGNGSIFEWDINADSVTTGFDKVTATGTVSVGTSTTFQVNLGADIFADGDFVNAGFWKTGYGTKQEWDMAAIFGQSLTTNSSFTSVTILQNVGTYGSFSINSSTLTWNAVPEPTSALVGLLIGAGLLRRRRSA